MRQIPVTKSKQRSAFSASRGSPDTSSKIPSRIPSCRGARRRARQGLPPGLLAGGIRLPSSALLLSLLFSNTFHAHGTPAQPTLSLCAPASRPLLVALPASRAPLHPARLRTPPAGSGPPPAAGAPQVPARMPPPRAANPAGLETRPAAQASPSLNLTLSLSPSILAPAAPMRTIESGKRMFRL